MHRPYIRYLIDYVLARTKISARYEHARWDYRTDNRRVYPFEWGLEHIGGPPLMNPDSGVRTLHGWVNETLAHSDEWFSLRRPADDYVLAFLRENGRIRWPSSYIYEPDCVAPGRKIISCMRDFSVREPRGPAVVFCFQTGTRNGTAS